MDDIPIAELHRLPFVSHVPTDGRRVVLQSYFSPSDRDWYLYLEVKPGFLGRLGGGEPVYGGYLSTEPANPQTDLELPFSTLVVQHLSFPKVQGRLQALENDVHQCAAILAKYRLISDHAGENLRSSFLIASELEYLLLVVRSMYDLLQCIVADIANLLVVLDGSNRRLARQVPQSFREVVLTGDGPRSGDDIVAKYHLPPALANWYVGETAAFLELRKLRDGVAHHGRTAPTLFELPEGIALDATDKMWSEFLVWTPEQRLHDKFGSVRALFAAIILNFLGATSRFADAIRATVQLPPAIGVDVRSYLRSPFGARLVELPDILVSPWERVPLAKTSAQAV